MKVIEAPQWLKDRMEKLKQLPPPTMEEVEQQMEASAEIIRQIDEEFLGRLSESGLL